MGVRSLLKDIGELPVTLRARRLAAGYRIAGGYRRIYHYHIPKTGGTSINTMFLGLAGMPAEEVYQALANAREHRALVGPYVFANADARLIRRGDYFYAFSHVPAHRLKLPRETFTFTVFRDPVGRVLSRYNELARYRENGVDHPIMAVEGQGLGEGLAAWVKHLPRERLFNQISMFSPRFDPDEAFDRVARCSYFFFTEAFDDGAGHLARTLHLELEPIHARKGTHAAPVTEREREALRERLDDEYTLLERLRRLHRERWGDSDSVAPAPRGKARADRP